MILYSYSENFHLNIDPDFIDSEVYRILGNFNKLHYDNIEYKIIIIILTFTIH